ncbi:hypothetical protein ACLOJK_035738 [Asimina triloba]
MRLMLLGIMNLLMFPLMPRSGLLERLIGEALNERKGDCVIRLPDIPGGNQSFELVARFCYGVNLELTAANVGCLRCAAEYLEMSEEYGEGNLISQTEFFLNQVVSRSWKDSIKALQTCEVGVYSHASAYEFTSISQQFVSKEGVVNQRGRVLGGSTAINGGFYSRASEEYVKGAGWDPELVREAYEWAESKIVFRPSLTAWQSVAADGMVEAGIRPFNGFSLEHLQGTKVGGSIFDAHGRRHTSADILAAAGDSNKITLLLNATVQNVIFHDAGRGKQPRAHGIRFIRSNGNPNKFYDVYLNHPNKVSRSWGDVILCAGAMGSPQILMLSGIGPKEHLTHFNITPLIDVRSVGQSMQDNPAIIIPLNYSSHALQKLHDPDPSQVVGIVNGFRIIIEAAVFYPSFNTSIQPVMGGKLAYPVSRGSLRLVSADPRQNPSAKFNYLAKEKDLDECVKMVPLIEEVAQSRSISAFLGRRQSRLSSKEGTSSSYRKELRDLCKKNVHLHNKIMGTKNQHAATYNLEKYLISITINGIYVRVELGGQLGYHIDVLACSTKNMTETLRLFQQLIIPTIQGLCHGVTLTESVLRSECVKNLTPPRYQRSQFVHLQQLKEVLLTVPAESMYEYQHTWSSVHDGNRPILPSGFDFARDLLSDEDFREVLHRRYNDLYHLANELAVPMENTPEPPPADEPDSTVEASMLGIAKGVEAVLQRLKIIQQEIKDLKQEIQGLRYYEHRLLIELHRKVNYMVNYTVQLEERKVPNMFYFVQTDNYSRKLVTNLISGMTALRLHMLCEFRREMLLCKYPN